MCNKKTVGYKNNTENSSTTKASEHILSVYKDFEKKLEEYHDL